MPVHNAAMLINPISIAKHCAQASRFKDMQSVCRTLLAAPDALLADVLAVGHLYYQFGFFMEASACFERAQATAPKELSHQINLAAVLRDMGQHHQAGFIYDQLLQQLPDHAVVQRNALISLEYDPDVSDAVRLARAKAWGQWAIARVGGIHSRPTFRPLEGRALRVGYVSADLCQHTVGLFLKDVLKAHDKKRVQLFAYSAGSVKDWLTSEIATGCTMRDVSALDDEALVQSIRADAIDVLVDLSGHTSGSRLTAFAHRPAPVLVSWLGYFATTGLPVMDAVLLDEWHAPPGTESQFVEPIIRLPAGRFCYTPVPWAPDEVSAPPCLQRGFITFGCFNNTAKYNKGLLDLWAKVLIAVPGSRLVLKWRSFNDEDFCQHVSGEFAKRGVAPERIELRGPSFHADMLKEYADIDIALDPFPFTGGLTSCEALWMGVPVVTWPQSRVVSRQTHALLHQIGLSELSVNSADDYVCIAAKLAADPATLAQMRATLRDLMRASQLMDTTAFARQIEDALIGLYRKLENVNTTPQMESRMTTIKINGKDYDIDSLTQDARAQLEMLLATEAEIRRLQTQLAIFQTAKNAYSQALAEAVSHANTYC